MSTKKLVGRKLTDEDDDGKRHLPLRSLSWEKITCCSCEINVWITGRVKASVLPEPVDAAITKFSPFRSLGMTAFWTGVGVMKPVNCTVMHWLQCLKYKIDDKIDSTEKYQSLKCMILIIIIKWYDFLPWLARPLTTSVIRPNLLNSFSNPISGAGSYADE